MDQGCILRLVLLSMRSNVRKMSSPKIDRYKYNMTSLIIEARLTSYEVFYLFIFEDAIFRTLAGIESNQHHYITLI